MTGRGGKGMDGDEEDGVGVGKGWTVMERGVCGEGVGKRWMVMGRGEEEMDSDREGVAEDNLAMPGKLKGYMN